MCATDYTKLLGIFPSNSPQLVETRRLSQALGPRIAAAQKRETGEMVDKLKGLGNSILGAVPSDKTQHVLTMSR